MDLRRARAPEQGAIWRMVVPRTMESSIMTTRLPSTDRRSGASLIMTELSRLSCVGWMKVRPMYLFLMSPSP